MDSTGPSTPVPEPVIDMSKDTLQQTLKDGKLGGKINVKTKTGDPAYDMSKLFYGLYGMENFPGYLTARFARDKHNHVNDLEFMEKQLEEKLAMVKKSKKVVVEREQLLKTYVPKMTLPEPEQIFSKELLRATENNAYIPSALTEVVPRVYTFDLFTPEFCEQLLDQVKHFGEWKKEATTAALPVTEDLSQQMTVVDQMGDMGEKLLDTLRDVIVDPLAKTLYPEVDDPNSKSSYRYGFILGYSNKPGQEQISRKKLDAHTDDSEVTLTVCLGRDYKGGEVVLRHLRSDPKEGEVQDKIKMKTGEATLFLGQQMHEVQDITEGERYIFVLWFRREKYRAATCPCCRMFRRERCVFGSEFN
jgi:hypothetical protein